MQKFKQIIAGGRGRIRQYLPLLTLIVFIVVICAPTVNDTMFYSPDSANYVAWAKSLYALEGYRNTLIPEPTRYVTNAPLYPLLIAIPVGLSTEPVHAAKWTTLFFGVLLLAALYEFVRRKAGVMAAAVAGGVLATHPLFLLYSTQILSDIPFAFFLVASLVLMDKILSSPEKEPASGLALLMALLAAMFLRDVGIALVVSACVVLWFKRRQKLATAIFGAAFVLFLVWYIRNEVFVASAEHPGLQNMKLMFAHVLTAGDQSVVVEIMARIRASVEFYGGLVGSSTFLSQNGAQIYAVINEVDSWSRWITTSLPALFSCVTLVTIFFVAVGLFGTSRVFRWWGFFPMFVFMYGTIILVYPIADIRFLFPLIIVLVGSGAITVHAWIAVRRHPRTVGTMVVLTIVCFSIPNFLWINNYFVTARETGGVTVENTGQTSRLVPLEYGKRWRDIGRWISQNTLSGDVIVSRYAELGLWSDARKIIPKDPYISPVDFGSTFRDYGNPLIVVNNWGEGLRDFQFQMASLSSWRFKKIHSAGSLEVYQALPAENNGPSVADTMALQRGLDSLIAGRYVVTAHIFSTLDRSEIAGRAAKFYQAIVAQSLHDEKTARRLFVEVCAGPQGGSALVQVMGHREAMNFVEEARLSPSPVEKAELLVSASISYWYLGLPRLAEELTIDACSASPSSVNPYLFRGVYLLAMGKKVSAREVLRALPASLGANESLQRLSAIVRELDSLDHALPPAMTSELLGRIASHYEWLGLTDHALDYYDRACKNSGSNADLLRGIGRILIKKERFYPAMKVYSRICEKEPSDENSQKVLRVLRERCQ